jgi:K(+)-stimulated pyrophosphate-energized sodium pump
MSFLKFEYKYILWFVLFFIIVLFYLSYKIDYNHHIIIVSFILGSLFSMLSGLIGMKISTKTNIRTTEAAKYSLLGAFNISFFGGSIMGTGVTGLAILGLGLLFIFFIFLFLPDGLFSYNRDNLFIIIESLTGFSLGAESVALFSRVGGGIYTKSADIGADLVGKMEMGIPEDDCRNPATIADNVGDNVGDIAGMGSDLFGSFVATILAAMVLGCEINTLYIDDFDGLSPVILPLLMCSFGVLLSIFSFFFIKFQDTLIDGEDVQRVLNKGNLISIFLNIIFSFFLINILLPSKLSFREEIFTSQDVFYSVLIGLIIGMLITYITEYFTSMDNNPVKFIVSQSFVGHATNVIAGLSVGMISTVLPILIFSLGIYFSFYFSGFYGVAMSAVGMMSTTTIQLSIDAFGPIADNAGGIAEMTKLDNSVRKRTDILDTIGNTTAATGKGFAIASAALTSLALFSAFVGTSGIYSIDIYKASVLSGLFIGGMVPFFFSALIIKSIGKSAMLMVKEVRRQLSIKEIIDGKLNPDYNECINIATKSSISFMMFPGILSIIFPIIIGFFLGPEVLGGFLAGLTISGILMAIFQSNAGGA